MWNQRLKTFDVIFPSFHIPGLTSSWTFFVFCFCSFVLCRSSFFKLLGKNVDDYRRCRPPGGPPKTNTNIHRHRYFLTNWTEHPTQADVYFFRNIFAIHLFFCFSARRNVPPFSLAVVVVVFYIFFCTFSSPHRFGIFSMGKMLTGRAQGAKMDNGVERKKEREKRVFQGKETEGYISCMKI